MKRWSSRGASRPDGLNMVSVALAFGCAFDDVEPGWAAGHFADGVGAVHGVLVAELRSGDGCGAQVDAFVGQCLAWVQDGSCDNDDRLLIGRLLAQEQGFRR
jgi:hypothetical protein